MKDVEAKAISDSVLLAVLGREVFVTSSVSSGFDHYDDPSLFVVAHLKPGLDVLSGRVSGEAIVALGQALEAKGETRFPYLSFEYPDDEPPPELDVEALAN